LANHKSLLLNPTRNQFNKVKICIAFFIRSHFNIIISPWAFQTKVWLYIFMTNITDSVNLVLAPGMPQNVFPFLLHHHHHHQTSTPRPNGLLGLVPTSEGSTQRSSSSWLVKEKFKWDSRGAFQDFFCSWICNFICLVVYLIPSLCVEPFIIPTSTAWGCPHKFHFCYPLLLHRISLFIFTQNFPWIAPIFRLFWGKHRSDISLRIFNRVQENRIELRGEKNLILLSLCGMCASRSFCI
jgi:hypothetical protein